MTSSVIAFSILLSKASRTVLSRNSATQRNRDIPNAIDEPASKRLLICKICPEDLVVVAGLVGFDVGLLDPAPVTLDTAVTPVVALVPTSPVVVEISTPNVVAAVVSAESATTGYESELAYPNHVNVAPLAGVVICPDISESACVPAEGVFVGLYTSPVDNGASYPRPPRQSMFSRYDPQFAQGMLALIPKSITTFKPMRVGSVLGQTSKNLS